MAEPSSRGASRTLTLTALSLSAFAANSLLCRAALRPHAIDAASFTSVRLLAGAAALAVLVRARDKTVRLAASGGSFASAAALFGYASTFSLAYVHLDAGTGALLLFGAVQVTMVGWGLLRGERPSGREWVGLIAAIGGLVLLTFPSLSSPPPLPAGAMLAAGIAWGIYSLRGRATKDALGATASNFARSVRYTRSLASSRTIGRCVGMTTTSSL